MICDKCGMKVDTGRLIKGIGFLCNMCFSWVGVKNKKRKEDEFTPDWNVRPEFLKDLLMLLEGI